MSIDCLPFEVPKTERLFITTLVATCEVIQGYIYPPSVDIHVLFCWYRTGNIDVFDPRGCLWPLWDVIRHLVYAPHLCLTEIGNVLNSEICLSSRASDTWLWPSNVAVRVLIESDPLPTPHTWVYLQVKFSISRLYNSNCPQASHRLRVTGGDGPHKARSWALTARGSLWHKTHP